MQPSNNSHSNGNKISTDNYCSSSGMVGIGNSPFVQSEKSWMQTARDKMTSAASATAAAALGSSSSSHSKSTDSNGNLNGKGNRFHFMSNLSHSSDLLTSPTLFERNSDDVANHAVDGFASTSLKSNPTALSNPQSGNLGTSNSTASQWRADNDNSNNSAIVSQPFKGGAGLAASDGEYERALVSAICNHVGLKPTPTEEALRAFLCTARVLSPDTVGLCLLEQLNSDHWQSRNKALVVVERLFPSSYLCNSNSDDNYSTTGCLQHAQWWRIASNVDALQSMLADTKASVRAQAGRTLEIVISSLDPSMTSSSSTVDRNVENDNAAVSYNSNSGVGPVPIIPSDVQLINWEDEIDTTNLEDKIIEENEKVQCGIEAREIANLLGMGVEEHGDLTHRRPDIPSNINDQSNMINFVSRTIDREISNLASTNEILLDRFDVSAVNSACATGGAPPVDDIFAGLTVTASSYSAPSIPFTSTQSSCFPTSSVKNIMSLPPTTGVSSTYPSTDILVNGNSSSHTNNNTNNHIQSGYSHYSNFNNNKSNLDIGNYGGGVSKNSNEGIFAVSQRSEASHPPILSVPLQPHFPQYPSSSIHTVNGGVYAVQDNSSNGGYVNVYRGDSYSRSQMDHGSINCKSNSGFSFNPHSSSTNVTSDKPKFRDVSVSITSHSLENKSGSDNPVRDDPVDSFSFLSDVLKNSSEATASSHGNKR